MPDKMLVLYGSCRSDRMGIPLADYLVSGLDARGAAAELVDAKAVGVPMLDRMYREYPKGEAPPALEALAEKIRSADAFVFVTGEYNWGPQPGLQNLTDHFVEEWFWRPAAIASCSAGRFSGVRSGTAWRGGPKRPARNGRGGHPPSDHQPERARQATGQLKSRAGMPPSPRLW
ncbi:MAG: NAD(P)H-dependent oxidoreductase [Pseudomonadota bacterium]|nr:NAD(P)H-dependent oxidoreductase [Pseudomonadota bacterium]